MCWAIETKDVARLTSTYILHECILQRLSDEKFSNILHRMQLVLFHNTTHGRSVHQSLRGMTGAEGRRISWNLQGLCSLYPRASLAKRWQPCGFRRTHLFSAFLITIVGPRCGLSTASYASQGVAWGRQWRRRIPNISCRHSSIPPSHHTFAPQRPRISNTQSFYSGIYHPRPRTIIQWRDW